MPRRSKKVRGKKPRLEPGLSVEDFTDYYWFKDQLIELARELGLPTHGYKPELSARIERRLRGLPSVEDAKPRRSRSVRDSDRPLTRDTPVVNYKSDAKTRAFFKSEIGPEFHFTYHVNQYRLYGWSSATIRLAGALEESPDDLPRAFLEEVRGNVRG